MILCITPDNINKAGMTFLKVYTARSDTVRSLFSPSIITTVTSYKLQHVTMPIRNPTTTPCPTSSGVKMNYCPIVDFTATPPSPYSRFSFFLFYRFLSLCLQSPILLNVNERFRANRHNTPRLPTSPTDCIPQQTARPV